MGPVQGIPSLRLQGNGKDRRRSRPSDSEIAFKTVHVQVENEIISFDYNQNIATVGWLIGGVLRFYKGQKKIVALRTKENIEILDHMLCTQNMPIKYLNDEEELSAVFSEGPAIEGLCAYSPVKVLGKGGFSVVTLVRNKNSGILYVIKTVNKDFVIQNRRAEHILCERQILSSIVNPFIIKIHSSFQTVFKN